MKIIYDDECAFCEAILDDIITENKYELIGFSELDEFPSIVEQLPENYGSCFHILKDGEMYSCGKAFSVLLENEYEISEELLYVSNPLISVGYTTVAKNRGLFSKGYFSLKNTFIISIGGGYSGLDPEAVDN